MQVRLCSATSRSHWPPLVVLKSSRRHEVSPWTRIAADSKHGCSAIAQSRGQSVLHARATALQRGASAAPPWPENGRLQTLQLWALRTKPRGKHALIRAAHDAELCTKPQQSKPTRPRLASSSRRAPSFAFRLHVAPPPRPATSFTGECAMVCWLWLRGCRASARAAGVCRCLPRCHSLCRSPPVVRLWPRKSVQSRASCKP